MKQYVIKGEHEEGEYWTGTGWSGWEGDAARWTRLYNASKILAVIARRYPLTELYLAKLVRKGKG